LIFYHFSVGLSIDLRNIFILPITNFK